MKDKSLVLPDKYIDNSLNNDKCHSYEMIDVNNMKNEKVDKSFELLYKTYHTEGNLLKHFGLSQ